MYYVNAKMILFETIPEMVWGGGGIEESDGGGKFKYDVFDTL
jgi:hypothetical protein